MANPFDRASVDGTDAYAIPLTVTVVDKLFLKPLPPVIGLRLESPRVSHRENASSSSGP